MLLMAIKIRNIITNTGKMNQMRTGKKNTWWDQNRKENGQGNLPWAINAS